MEFLKKLLGKSFKEDMTLEDINKELEKINLYTENDMKEYVPKTQYDKASQDASDWKKKYRNTLSEKEQAELEYQERQSEKDAELEKYRKDFQISKFEKEYIKQGYNEENASKVAQAMYENDTETLFKLQSEHIQELQKENKRKQMEDTPPPPTGGSGKTKSFSEMTIDERTALKTESPDLYEELKGGNE